MPSLASLLTRDAVVPIEVIERALERQTLEGGELDTALLELDAVPENVLAAYRAATFKLEAAGRGELLRIEPAVLDCVPAKLAERLQIVPIAMQEGTLIVASFLPLDEDQRRQLEGASATEIDVRIATEARVIAALERHYAIDMSERMRKLAAQLDVRNPGALVQVDPDRPSKRFTPPPPMHVPQQANRTQRLNPTAGPPSDAPVHLSRVVELAERVRELGTAETQDATETRPMRPSKLILGRKSDSRERERSPLPVDPALLSRFTAAPDRAAVEDAMLLHIAERFACTVLFEVRDKHLMGRAAIGLGPGVDARSVEAPMSRGLQAIVLAGQARVLDLLRDCPGDALPALIDRMASQPCVVLPVSLSKRVVIAVYADSAGKPIADTEIDVLTPALAAAGQALERILHDRKVGALEARKSQLPPSAFPAENDGDRPVRESKPGPKNQTDIGIAPSQSPDRTSSGLDAGSISGSIYKQREIDNELSQAALRSLPPRPGGTERPPPVGAMPELTDHPKAPPTVVMPRASDRRSPSDTPSVSERSTEREPTQPERPSSLSAREGMPARLLSQHPAKGAGSYAMRDIEDAEQDTRASKAPVQRASYAHAAREEVVQRGPTRGEHDPRRESSPGDRESVRETARETARNKRSHDAPTLPRDPRRDGDDRSMRADVVSVPPAIRESLRPAAHDEGDALNIDLTGEADRLVDRLAASQPGEETPLVSALVRLGHAGVAALVRRFPGPSWAQRGQLHKRTVPGRDLGPLPRALWAFDDEMIPAIQELLEAPRADSRLYAAVLAGDRVHPELLWPLYRRLFDPEGSMRLVVSETLPLYRNAQGFDDVLKSLRKRGGDPRESLQNRLAAIEAVASLRDVGSIELLSDLAGLSDRQYSLPAQRALVAITGQDFGDATRKWKAWHEKNAQRSRAQWLIESLMHSEERVRATAGNELQKLTHVYYGFTASAPKRDRERAQERYRAWWEQEGKAQFGNR